MKAKELFDMGKPFAEKILAERGHIVPQVLVHVSVVKGELDVIGMPVYDEDQSKQDKLRSSVLVMIKMAKKKGVYEGALMVSEAWMATVDKKDYAQNNFPRAKDSPNRVEVAIIGAWGNADKFTGSYRIEGAEGDNKRRMGEMMMEGDKFESWLDESL